MKILRPIQSGVKLSPEARSQRIMPVEIVSGPLNGLRGMVIDQRKLRRTIMRQLRRAIRDIETARKRVEVTRATIALARTQLEAEQVKFRLGLSTIFTVLTFQEDLTIARTDGTRAVSDYNVALARLDQLTGIRYGEAPSE